MKRLLLDSNVLLWAVLDSPRLGPVARKMLDAETEVIYYSLVSVWELAIKSASGKLKLDGDFAESAEAAGFIALPLTAAHCWRAAHLPKHHADPFDRLLVAQTEIDGLTLLTSDGMLAAYGISIIDAEQ